MKQDTKLIRVDLNFQNTFNSAGPSSLWKILEGFGVQDVSLLSSIYELSTMRIQVGSKSSAAIQLDTGTVQGSALSPLLFDLFINALLRLLDSTEISHRVRGVPDWNHQAFADDLSLYVSSTEDANTLLDIVREFQEWSGLKISIKKSLATGALKLFRARPKQTKKRRLPNKMSKETAIKRLVSRVNRITKTIETKSGVTQLPDGIQYLHNTLYTVNNTFLATNAGVGDSEFSVGQHIGDKITLKGVSFKMMLELNERYSDVTFRMMLIRSEKGDVPVQSTMWMGASA